jgi:hypothetical protein
MYSQRINTSWQGKTTWKYGTGKVQSFEPESNLLVYSLTFRAMPIATRIVTYGEVSTFITSIYMPNSAVLHRFIADKVRNCQVFNPIVSIFSKLLSTSATWGCIAQKCVKWAEFLLTRYLQIFQRSLFWWPKRSLSVIISMPSSSKCVA